MASFSAHAGDAAPRNHLHTRALGDVHRKHPHTDQQETTLQVLALTFSAVSVTSSFLAFYWFIKMRRTFRHDLIMLLIQSDMFKAFWFMVYPIVTFVNGPVNSHSTFCQVNGFFLAVGIESSDFSVLMIAIHTALYIFVPRSSSSEAGLYPYRKWAYGIYLFLPLLLASLAFINDADSYISDGTYCYLPVRPFWYRLALSWIPRYLIFLFILGIYASIYFYVGYKFRGFSGENQTLHDSESTVNETKTSSWERKSSIPAIPPLAVHGLIPPSTAATDDKIVDGITISAPIADTQRKDSLARRGSVHHFMLLASFTTRVQPQIPIPSSEHSDHDSDSFLGPTSPQPITRPPETMPVSPQSAYSEKSSIPSHSRGTSWRDDFVKRFSPQTTGSPADKRSINVFSFLRRRPDDDPVETDTPTPVSQLHLTNSHGQDYVDLEMLRVRDKIRRQLRFLFIYPLVYIGMWIVPFASHVLQYDDRIAVDPPFGLSCVTTVCVTMQAAVDCWLFSTREKPWRHIPDTNGGFWESLKFWTGWKGVSKRKVARGPGKTRDEMVKEARSAYRRRDDEMAQRRNQVIQLGDGSSSHGPKKPERSWWDAGLESGGSGNLSAVVMTPLTEKGNPLNPPETMTKENGIELEKSGDEKFDPISEADENPPSPTSPATEK